MTLILHIIAGVFIYDVIKAIISVLYKRQKARQKKTFNEFKPRQRKTFKERLAEKQKVNTKKVKIKLPEVNIEKVRKDWHT